MKELHHESLEEEATHATDEARMLLPGVQAVMGFQLVAVFNTRFVELSAQEQRLHFGAFLLLILAMGLIMAPAAYHRQAERGVITRRFINLASLLLTCALFPLALGVALDTYLIASLIFVGPVIPIAAAVAVGLVLLGLWFTMPSLARNRNARRVNENDTKRGSATN